MPVASTPSAGQYSQLSALYSVSNEYSVVHAILSSAKLSGNITITLGEVVALLTSIFAWMNVRLLRFLLWTLTFNILIHTTA